MPMQERAYQAKLINKLRDRYVGCFILKNDSSYLQGIPDILILYRDRWGMLEVKREQNSAKQANQAYYISELNHMSFAAFIHPDIEDAVLADLDRVLLGG